jgi:hypothetical protein
MDSSIVEFWSWAKHGYLFQQHRYWHSIAHKLLIAGVYVHRIYIYSFFVLYVHR